MINKLQARWVFTWNACPDGGLPPTNAICEKLDEVSSEGVFQLEVGETTRRKHFQGRFKLKGARRGKRSLLKDFSEIFDTTNLTLEPELSRDSSSYCEKSETRIAGPWYVGTTSYVNSKQPMKIELKNWQSQLIGLMQSDSQDSLRDRKVIWIQDTAGGQGKSTFIRYLAMNKKNLKLEAVKLPVDQPARIRSAVIKLAKKTDIDLYMFDFTRTQGVDTHFNDLFEVIEEIKNAYVVDTMYGNYNTAFLKQAMIMIFTNHDIQEFKKYLSEDRWVPFTICQKDNSLSYLSYVDINTGHRTPIDDCSFPDLLDETKK